MGTAKLQDGLSVWTPAGVGGKANSSCLTLWRDLWEGVEVGRALGLAESGAQSCNLVYFLPLNHHSSSEFSAQRGESKVFTGEKLVK